ncbi:MAG: ABC transporter substrate-binding protein [Gammaproteobacteria bacterium]
MRERSEVRIGVTWANSGWCWLDSRFLYPGTRIWVSQVNDRGGMYVPEAGRKLPVRLIAYDDRSHPEVSVAAVRELCEKDRIDVFCSSGSSECQAEVLPVTERHRIVNLNVGAPDPKFFQMGYRYHLQCGPALGAEERPEPKFWKQHGLTRIADLYADFIGFDAFHAGVKPAVEAEGGLEMVFHEPVPRQERWSTQYGPYRADFDGWADIVRRLKAARPDVVKIGLPAPAEYRLMKEMRRQGVWFKHLELLYGPELTKIGLGAEDLLYQFDSLKLGLVRHADDPRINVGGSFEELVQAARRYMPGVNPLYSRSYVALAIWEHLVAQAGSMDADAVMAQAQKESGRIHTMDGPLRWTPTWDTEPVPGTGVAGVCQIQRDAWSGELASVPVWPPAIARAEPVFTELPYEQRPVPWGGIW